jgi:hypothetical protein
MQSIGPMKKEPLLAYAVSMAAVGAENLTLKKI